MGKWEEKIFDELKEDNLIGLVRNTKQQSFEFEFDYLKMNNITNDGNLNLLSMVKVNASKDELEKYALQKRDFLFNTRNSVELVGKTAVYDIESAKPMLFNNNIMRSRFKKGYDPYFINYQFKSSEFQERLEKIKSGTTSVAAIYYKSLKNIKLKFPPLIEQQRIVAKLDGLFAKIDKAIGLLEANILHTQALMGSVLDEIYSDGDIMLKDACILGPKKSEVRDLDDNLEVSFLPMRDLNEHDINFVPNEIKKISEVYKGYTYFADGDVVLAKVTPCFENGKAGLAKDLTNGIGFGSSEYHVLRAKENVLPEWIYFAVLTEQFRVTGKENMTGAGGLKRVPRPFLEEWKIPVPELSIQKKQIKRIVQIQEETKNLESSIQEKLNHLKALKSSLLDQAFKGEL
ncbi:restriction endonuclease subunit S [Winogradskyella ludwigii]|uniref:restriction endonuclease subunit S n=1 Tax=Winogradskyella ludwigii TaxID=2686076 RepID=UPI0021D1EE0D|nr:restriction endonuclease subunit S [Winogradskyella ludwigii]